MDWRHSLVLCALLGMTARSMHVCFNDTRALNRLVISASAQLNFQGKRADTSLMR